LKAATLQHSCGEVGCAFPHFIWAQNADNDNDDAADVAGLCLKAFPLNLSTGRSLPYFPRVELA